MKENNLLGTLLTWLAVGILAVVALKVVFFLLGVTMALVAILFRLLPILLAGMLVWMVIRWFSKDRGGRAEPDPLDL
ncbi:MAG TPA: hypothetical protein VGR37_01435 [Longimicrobiaceae bacterium]|nr:hypothetical protein [Longimicrobiaceae bacterium]